MVVSKSVHPGTSSRGFSHKAVIITGISADGLMVTCKDNYGREIIVRGDVQRAKGFPPLVGEQWFIDRMFGGWTLAACISTPAPSSGGGGRVIEPFSRSGTLQVEDMHMPFYLESADTILTVRASVWGAPTGSDLILDMQKNNATSLWSNPASRPRIVAGTLTGESAPDLPHLLAGDFISPRLVQVGSTYAGFNLVVTVQLSGSA